MKNLLFLFLNLFLIFVWGCVGCSSEKPQATLSEQFISRAVQTLDSLYTHYRVPDTCLLREYYPLKIDYSSAYSVSGYQEYNPYSYLWPYSGTFSAVCAVWEATQDAHYEDVLKHQVLPGLQAYYDDGRLPAGYASYIDKEPVPARFYDDNIWVGINFMEVYRLTGENKYLQQALRIWHFVESGMDDQLDGGIYWCEQERTTKNACSNAPGAVLALKLYLATGDKAFLNQGKILYHWVQQYLQDPSDCLYFDHITLDREVCKAKYAYNSGQMMQAAALLYLLTGQTQYLSDAQCIAENCYQYFFSTFSPEGMSPFRLLKDGDVWFTAVMLRGFIELYRVDGNRVYLECFRRNLDYAWEHAREENGLFGTDFSGRKKETDKWLLTQAAMVEMYARMASVFVEDLKTINLKHLYEKKGF